MWSAFVRRKCAPGRPLRLWRDQLGATPPYRTDASVLFVCFVANAECSCHLALGWPLPAKIFDLSPVFRSVVNGREAPHGKGLLGALGYFNIDSIGAKRKDGMRKRILEGWPFTAEERGQILDYCLSDIDALAVLLPKLLPHVELDTALHWGEFAAVSAVMEHRGVPIDKEIFEQLQDKKAWAFVRDAMVPKIDSQYGVYVKGADGDWHFNNAQFEQYCARAGIDWPRHETGKLNLRRKTFDSMSKAWPEVEASAPAAICPRQDAQDQACGRRRRSQPHGVMAVSVQDIAHATEGIAVDFLAGGLVALVD